MRARSLLAGVAAAGLGVPVAGHLARRIRRAHLSRRMLRMADDLPVRVLLEREVGVPWREGNAFELVENGAIFDALAEEIRGARESVHLCEFMWRGPGEPSDRIGRALLERRPGVEVRIVVDWFGSKRFDRALERRLEASGARVHRHLPWPDPLRLSHRRIVVIDGRTAYVGGFGIHRSWLGDGVADGGEDPAKHDWRDTSLRVRGPLVGDLQRAFDHSLQAARGGPLPGRVYPRLGTAGEDGGAVVASTPAWARTTLAARMYYAVMASARRRLLVANSYFVPDASLRHVLRARAAAGVEVRVLAPGPHHDVPIVRAGQRRTYDALLRGGVRVHEYAASMMHAKTLVADDVAVVGSTNVDSQSLSFLWETSVVAGSARVADRLAAIYQEDLARSREIRLDAWRRRPLAEKLGEHVSAVAEPWL